MLGLTEILLIAAICIVVFVLTLCFRMGKGSGLTFENIVVCVVLGIPCALLLIFLGTGWIAGILVAVALNCSACAIGHRHDSKAVRKAEAARKEAERKAIEAWPRFADKLHVSTPDEIKTAAISKETASIVSRIQYESRKRSASGFRTLSSSQLLLENNSDRSVVMGVRSSVERALINDGFKDVHVTVSNADGAEPRIYISCRW